MNKRRVKGRSGRPQIRGERREKEVVPGAALLLAFIKKNGIDYRAAAEALGLHHPAVWQWANSITIPRERYRGPIEVWTGGKVPASAWLRKSEQKPIEVQPYRPSGTEG